MNDGSYRIGEEIAERLAIQARYERFRQRRPWRWLPDKARGRLFVWLATQAPRSTPPPSPTS